MTKLLLVLLGMFEGFAITGVLDRDGDIYDVRDAVVYAAGTWAVVAIGAVLTAQFLQRIEKHRD